MLKLFSPLGRKRTFQFLAISSTLASIYCLMGVLQAASLFTGERLLVNFSLWSSLLIIFIFATAHLFLMAKRVALRDAKQATGFAVIFWLIAVALSIYPLMSHLIAVEICLDKGGSFNYIQGWCDEKNSHSSIAVWKSHGVFITLTAVTFVHFLFALRSRLK
jgi:hypothetical protein